MLEISNVYKSYDNGQNFAINNLSLSIYEGDHIAIVSESGGGKTTLLQMINRLTDITSGDIHIKGISIHNESERAVQQKAGYITDDSTLFPHLTVLENITLPLHEYEKDSNSIKQKAFEFMQLVRLDPYEIFDCYPEELTYIEKLQLIYARMLACKPDIILLDNPFLRLDRINKTELLDMIHSINQGLNKTIVYATDDIDDARHFADRIAILYEGRLIQSGEYQELLANPTDPHVQQIMKHHIAK